MIWEAFLATVTLSHPKYEEPGPPTLGVAGITRRSFDTKCYRSVDSGSDLLTSKYVSARGPALIVLDRPGVLGRGGSCSPPGQHARHAHRPASLAAVRGIPPPRFSRDEHSRAAAAPVLRGDPRLAEAGASCRTRRLPRPASRWAAPRSSRTFLHSRRRYFAPFPLRAAKADPASWFNVSRSGTTVASGTEDACPVARDFPAAARGG